MTKIISRLVLIFAFIFSAQTAFALTDDSLHYWSFDEGGGRTISDSRGGQNGALVGTGPKLGWASGKSKTALVMDGTQGTAVVLPNDILGGTQGTIAVWFELEELSDRNILFSTQSTTNSNVYMVLMVDRDGRPQIQYRATASGSDLRAQGTKILNKNEWYYLVLAATGQTYRMFINGEEVTMAGDNTGLWFPAFSAVTPNAKYRIGALLDAEPLSGSLHGHIDELHIYSRAFLLAEAAERYAAENDLRPSVPPAIQPSIAFSISDEKVSYGGSVLLTWSTKNITSCSASGSWNEPVGLSGSKVITKLGADAAYKLTCVGEGGEVSSSVRVVVDKKEETEKTTPAQTPPATTVNDVQVARQAQIDALIRQIIVLIAELEKKIAELKANQ